METLFHAINFDDIKTQKEALFEEALTSRGYKNILALFNCKQPLSSVGQFFNIKNNDYADFILRHINGERREKIASILKGYMPVEIPFNP